MRESEWDTPVMDTSAPTNAIEVERLHKQYGQIEAIKDLTLEVRPGEILGLLGANGAGKTSLIRVLIGATRPTAGSARVLGLDPSTQPYQLRRHIGYMPQLPALYEDLSARDNIRFFARAHQLDGLEARVDDVLAFTDLQKRQHHPVYTFSGGMKQRVSLACALVHQPRLLLLDEPTAGVDPRLRESFWRHFRELAAQGVTMLVSTHQMDEVTHCDRAAVMRAGALLACDTPQGLKARGQTRITIWRDGQPHSESVSHYADELPGLLGISPDVERIQIEEDNLEAIILSLISHREQEDA